MKTQSKTPVDIIQELILIHTTRMEACSKLQAKQLDDHFKSRVNNATEQSKHFIKALMNELSNFGDAVKADVSSDNEYHKLYKEMLATFDTENTQGLIQLSNSMEESLKTTYLHIIESRQEFSASLMELLNKQFSAIEKTLDH